jgi:L-fuculose-phosphate aldolase
MTDVTASALRECVAETGRLLLEKELVVRTWGNFSARLGEDRFLITPTGLGYEAMTAEDIVSVDRATGEWEGTRRPSSESGIHAAAYAVFPDAAFVIHTHPVYATAVGLTGPGSLPLTEEERASLGGIAWASYALPGTKRLRENVERAMRSGAETVLMARHGVVICGRDREEAVGRAERLEEIAKRSVRGLPDAADGTEPERAWAELGIPLIAELDDMAQMIGRRIPFAADEEAAERILRNRSAVFVRGKGCLFRSADADESEALKRIVRKAAVAALHTRASGVDARLGLFDTAWMRFRYRTEYAKKKNG